MAWAQDPPAAEEAAKPADEKPAAEEADKFAEVDKDVTQGALRIPGEEGKLIECPLEHTDVVANVSGFISRVTVTQTFHNPTKEKIEAVYVFPLPHQAAVDDMTMKIGERKIVGVIKRRDEARRIYEAALMAGQTAALLEQERPNIFTQSVGNIGPGERIEIVISYVDVLKYDMGTYEFHYPMVVGPRYNPGNTAAGPAVPDAARITPPVLKPGERTSHDISISVNLDAGVPIHNLANSNHKVHTIKKGDSQARVRLLQEDAIPNKDFVLRYDVMGAKPEMAVLSHTGDYAGDAKRLGSGYFMLMIQPKEDERLKQSPPREIVFLVDVSGSMRGEPTEKVKGAMKEMLELCRAGKDTVQDTVQVVTFAGQAHQLFEKPLPVNEANTARAIAFSQAQSGSGGTEMLKGVTLAMDQPVDAERIRIIVMLTDGYIGNEAQIIEHVGKKCGDRIRFWAIGIGQSPNMFLIDGVARQGGGMGKKLGLKDDSSALTTEVMTRIQRAQLADVQIDYGDLDVSETYPARLPELWAGRPVIVYGRYNKGGQGTIKISGNVEGEDVSWPLEVTLSAEQPEHDVLAKVWAREKIEDLMQSAYYGDSPAVEEEVTALALQYRLMSQYTSFVAVDAEKAGELDAPATPPRRMTVPLPLPEGTQYEGFFGGGEGDFYAGHRFALDDDDKDRSEKLSDRLALKEVARPMERITRMTRSTAAGRRLMQAGDSGINGLRKRTAGGYGPAAPAPGGGGFGYGGLGGGGLGGGGLPGVDLARRGYAPAQGQGATANLSLVVSQTPEEAEQLGHQAADYTVQALSADAEKLVQQARQALKDGQDLQKDGKRAEAREQLLRASLLDYAAMNLGQSSGETADAALAALEEIRERQIAEWKKALPALDKKLDVVLRDRTLPEALTDVAKSAGLNVELLEGSVDDATTMTGQSQHITYLDLRRATAAQALDWLLQPAKMNWIVSGDKIVAGTDRRREGVSAWVYDVSTIALPADKKLAELGDYQKALEAAKQDADAFLAATRTALSSDANAVVWYGPGQVLVIGDAKLHQQAAKLLADLASPDFKAPAALAKLHAVTSQRAKERAEAVAKRRAAQELFGVAAVHDHFGWALLAEAAAGKLDLEALTELQIAWNRRETDELLSGKGAALALRSLWNVQEAARALPENDELQTLAAAALAKSQAAIRAQLDALAKNDVTALYPVLFAALADRDNGELRAEALRLLTTAGAQDAQHLSSTRIVASALLDKQASIDRASLAKLAEGNFGGDEMTLLTALACRRAGGDVWQAFRASARDNLSRQPLSGNVIVVISRLPRTNLELVSEE
jgi:Ca-activated chloride channel family protein